MFDAHTLGVLELSQPGADVPAFPLNYIKRVNVGTSENEVLLPQVLDLLRSLPGAKDKCLQGRKAVLYNGIVFVDTHKQYYLNQKAPDISVIADGCAVSAFAALAVLELQVLKQGNECIEWFLKQAHDVVFPKQLSNLSGWTHKSELSWKQI